YCGILSEIRLFPEETKAGMVKKIMRDLTPGEDVPGQKWQSVLFPALRYAYPDDAAGIHRFRRTIVFSDSLRNKNPALYLGKLPDNCEVYFNGSLLYSNGIRTGDHFTAQIFSAHSILVPSGLVRYGKSNELLLRVVTERPYTALPSMFFSDWKDVKRKTDTINLLNPYLGVTATAVMMLTALYFLVLFILDRKKGKYLLMFAGSTGFAVNSTILYGSGFLFSFLLAFKIQFIGLYWGVSSILLFAREITDFKASRLFRNIIMGGTALLSAVLLFLPTMKSTIFFNDNLVYLIWITPQLLFCLFIAIRALKRKIKYSPILLIGILAAILGGLRDILIVQLGYFPDFYMNLMGLTILIICIFITYAAQFYQTERLVQQKTETLTALTQNLEKLVQERTAELEEANRKLSEQAITDVLTGAFNRLEFLRVLEFEEARYRRLELEYGAICLDLDNFKYINDTYGHSTGDFILRETTHMLNACMRSSDRLFRLGGDEFIILMTEIHSTKDVVLIAERILEEIKARDFFVPMLEKRTGQTVRYPEGKNLSISIGIGSTEIPEVRSIHDLPEYADKALLRAKSKGKNCYSE
ncbi:MAG: diguanylate cyclase, partial [Spirochaetales bacterium]|nr:diguanylate cyclase [Spirochaetales bacterium]